VGVTPELKRRLWLVVIGLAVAAVLCAGLGGMIDAPARTVLGAGALFCLVILILPAMFVVGDQGFWIGGHVSAGWGAVAGVCGNLFFPEDGGLAVLPFHALAGAAFGFGVFWLSVLIAQFRGLLD